MTDLFGHEIKDQGVAPERDKQHGYAALPGTGPAGETCGSCKFIYRKRMSKTYIKCLKMRAYWTGGAGTDIKARSPACRNWEQQEEN